MKFTLKDYQEEAVGEVLANLRKAAKRWHEDDDKHSFSLTATTGAGKTVMAAAVFEALFHGDDHFDFEPDPGAVVIWFSDDPALNKQSRFRLWEASDRISLSDLVIVQKTFNRDKLEAGKIYFLNTQKLSKSSLLVRGHNPDDTGIETISQRPIMPDMRSSTIWDVIQNTIEDKALTLYLMLDEAHRGMRKTATRGLAEKPTIIRRLINGTGSVPGIPIVWGISATVDRFNRAMADMQGRATLPNVVVDSSKVQASGLLKDTIVLDVPDEVGQYDTVLVRRGTDKLKEISKAWKRYALEQDDANLVLPLMVLQVPNKPDHNKIGRALDAIYKRWPTLEHDALAHVFGEHTTQTFGRYTVPYISPERVQQTTRVRVLIAKDAISTGWDCPRAEVMVSFRPAKDRTHITQLLGRMVRTPLARRIPGNERLNAVDCLLPFFNADSVGKVARALMSGDDEPGDGEGDALPGRRVLINPQELIPNPDIPEEVWEKLLSLPSHSLPRRQTNPVKRLTLLAHELAADGILPKAGQKAHSEMHKVLNAARERFREEIKDANRDVRTVEGKSLVADLGTGAMSVNDFLERADRSAIEDSYRRASRAISPDLARTYSELLARTEGKSEDQEELLIEAHVTVAALGLVPDVKAYLEAEAQKLAKKWLQGFRVKIISLSDERQDVYRQIREMSVDPIPGGLARPKSWMQPSATRNADGNEDLLPRFPKHFLAADDGLSPEEFNSWETEVLRVEMNRPDSIAWYRNPPRASQDSLGVSYESGNDRKIMRPDFIFFAELGDGAIAADIVDPHGTHLSDALPKLRGLAEYAATHGDQFRRIDAVAEIEETLMVLDLKDPAVRLEVESAASVAALYQSDIASVYQ